MEEKLYTIGEVSQIMGVSVQMLRNYCNLGVITPAFIDKKSGYRYFSKDQLHYIDRTRYLLKCGFSLKEISDLFHQNDISLLIRLLKEKKAEKLETIKAAAESVSILDWYQEYFIAATSGNEEPSYFVKHIPERTLVAIQCDESYQYDDFYALFGNIRNSKELKNVRYKRQFVSILDYAALLNRQIVRKHVGMLSVEPLRMPSKHVVAIPDGDYHCFRAHILNDEWDMQILHMIVDRKPTPSIIVAEELEDNLKDFRDSLYEIQILF